MYLEERIENLLEKQNVLIELITAFLPNLEVEKNVIHFLKITKTTFNSYLERGVLKENIHYTVVNNKKVYIPKQIIELKNSGVKFRRRKTKEASTVAAVCNQLGV